MSELLELEQGWTRGTGCPEPENIGLLLGQSLPLPQGPGAYP